MNYIFNVSRRNFLKCSALAGGGMILGIAMQPLDIMAKGTSRKASVLALNAFVRIGTDDSVTLIINHSEMGQGIYTGLAMIISEELDVDWSKVKVEAAPVDPVYNHTVFGMQATGGSTSTWTEWKRLREAGAAARAMLIAAAAETWKVDPKTCLTENGHVINKTLKKRLFYGHLAKKASKIKPPQNITLKDPENFRLIGKPTKRLDTPDKVKGKAVFGIDVMVPGMLTAVIARPPVFGAKVKSYDAGKTKSIQGVRYVVEIDRGIAVVADSYWQAHEGRDALKITWDEGPLAGFDSPKQLEEYKKLAGQSGAQARKEGDVDTAMNMAAKKLEATYDLPYLAHAPMETLNCVADVRPDSCEIWTGTQFQTGDRNAAAKASGLKPEQVKLHTMFLGGGFGRRAVVDSHFVLEAVEVSKAIKTPVKVIWSREDDIRGGYYRPSSHHLLSAGLNDTGNPTFWQHRIVCQSFVKGTPFEAGMFKNGVDATAVEGAADLPYEISNILVDWQDAPGGIPTQWWRSVGHSFNAFVVESFIDELSHAAGKDPYIFRQALLEKHPRHKAVLDLAVSKSGWNKPLDKGHGYGLAVHESFGSFVAQIAEVSVSEKGKCKIHRVVCAVDCGPVVNPDGIRAQMESAIMFGLNAALYGKITFEKGRVIQKNFDDYPILRIDEMPVVETYIVQSTEKMGGIGEPGVPPIAPAVTNAIFAATGKRIRRLPIRTEDLI